MAISLNVDIFMSTMKHQTRLVLIMVNVVILAILPVGFHMVVLNVPTPVVQNAIRTSLLQEFNYYIEQNALNVLWSLIVSSQSIGALIGCYFILPMIGSYGTKSALLLLSNSVLVLGSITMASAFTTLTPFLLLGGRILTGVYVGLACSLVPMYVHEIAPPDLRGAISCSVHIAVCIGSALGAILSLDSILGGTEVWGILMLVPAGIGALQILLSIYIIPESPNYYIRYQHCGKASKSVDFYYHPSKDEHYNAVIYYEQLVPEMPEQLSIKRVFSIPAIRNDVFIGMVVSAAQVFSGKSQWSSYCFGVAFLIYGVGYNLGVGPLAYFIPAELVERDAASVALGAAVSANWVSTLFTTLVYYPLNEAVGGYSYLLFAIPT
ncbi:hypothetical protein QR680_003030 [Steinernema hermaphroditum]|uniref:Major facilitator superfamily (MFS) profile domain-containing protein n=1 Tax=Steinernema hermaphroditum TaxID=289476 RepID=A0AA39LJB3_9BILA|nr:hypothetical protein QR680_003030 [Steinernema hermaphroditum]